MSKSYSSSAILKHLKAGNECACLAVFETCRDRHESKGLMSKTIAVHVPYRSLYISLQSSAQQQREIAAYCWYIYLELGAGITYLAGGGGGGR